MLTRLLSPLQIFALLPLTAPFALTSSGLSSSTSASTFSYPSAPPSTASDSTSSATQISTLEGEVARLKADLAKAKALNDKMWQGVVGGVLGPGAAPKAGVAAPAPVENGSTGAGGKRRR